MAAKLQRKLLMTSSHRFRLLFLGGIVVVISGLAFLTQLPEGTWPRLVQSFSVGQLLVGLALLPLAGFPISVLYVAVGARFGLGPGLVAAGLASLLHVCLSYPLARALRRPLLAIIEKAGWKLPSLDDTTMRPFTLLAALAPGLSYTLKNYLPPLAGIPFLTTVIIFLPIHLLTATVGLALGGVTMHFSWPLALGAVGYGAIIIWLTRHLARRIKAGRFQEQPA